MTLKEFIVNNGWAIGYAEVRRAILHGAVFVNSELPEDENVVLSNGDVVSYGRKLSATFETCAQQSDSRNFPLV